MLEKLAAPEMITQEPKELPLLPHKMNDRHRDVDLPPLSGFGIALLLVAATIGELAPFTPLCDWHEAWLRLLNGLHIFSTSVGSGELLERLILFLPLGWLVYRRTARRHRFPMGRSLLVTGAAVLALEAAQAFIPARHLRLSDALVGLMAGSVGVMLGRLANNRQMRILGLNENNNRRRIAVALLIGWELVLAGGIVLTHGRVGLSNWNDAYPLLLANEHTGDRPWIGKLGGVAIYAHALEPTEITNASALAITDENIATRTAWGAITLFTFGGEKNGRISQRIQTGPALDLLLPPPDANTWVLRDGTLHLRSPTVIRSEIAASALSDSLQRTGAFTIEVDLEIPNRPQYGPARILSISENSAERNVTLGQAGHDLVFRVRTPRMGDNGTWVLCRTHGDRLDPGPHHVAATFRDGVMRLYIDGKEARPPLRLYRASTLLFRGDFPGAAILAALLLVGPVGWLSSMIIRSSTRTRGVLLYGSLSALPAVAASLITAAATHREPGWLFLVCTVFAGLGGATAGHWWRGRRSSMHARDGYAS